MLLILSGSSDAPKEPREEAESLEEYRTMLETKLAETVSSVAGAGDARVMITFDSSFESVYAYNGEVNEVSTLSGGRSAEKQLVLIGSRGDEAPVLIKSLAPKIKGVLVVCPGGSEPAICKKISQAASTLFGIPESRIYVTE